jgi:hypothetical protein
MIHLCAGDLHASDFMTLLSGQSWPKDTLFIGFSPAEARFDRVVIMDTAFVSQTEQGRLFAASGELSWRRLDDIVRAVYIGENPPAGLSDCSDQLSGLNPVSRQVLLWGVRTENKDEWVEQQVPHRFVYPVDSREHVRGRVALIIEDWEDDAKNACFSRYHSISEIKGEN